ncbi:MAG: hypothetical protein IKJ37_16915 [Kiritimatiellae bacterium]|nr:hypothetical protein [Kiritimatiellia bacterium]
MKKAAGPNGPTAKKNPPAQCRKADEIYLRLQKKNAPFSTRKWLHGLYFLPIAKPSLPNAMRLDRRSNKGQLGTCDYKPLPPRGTALQDSPFYFHWGYQYCVESFSKHGSCASDA